MTTALATRPDTTPDAPGGSAGQPAGPHSTATSSRLPAPVEGGRNLGWDLLRSACVVMVLLYHSTYIGPAVYRQFVPRTFVFGHQVGASLLLCVSAFFIAATMSRVRGSTRLWWRARMARVLPGFVVATVAAWTSLRFLAPPGMFHPNLRTLLENLAMLWNWDGVRTWDYVDGSYWTIPLQLMAFTLAALIWRTPIGRGRGLRILMWAAVLVPLAQWDLRETSGGLYHTVVDGFGLYRWHLFVAGVAIWMLSTGRLGRRHATALIATCVLAHAIQIGEPTPTGGFTTDGWAAAGVGLGIVAMAVIACRPGLSARLPAPVGRAVTWLAGISYGVFLVHQTQGYVVMLWLQDTLHAGPGTQTIAMIAVGLLGGWALTRGVERPMYRRLTTRSPRPSGHGLSTPAGRSHGPHTGLHPPCGACPSPAPEKLTAAHRGSGPH